MRFKRKTCRLSRAGRDPFDLVANTVDCRASPSLTNPMSLAKVRAALGMWNRVESNRLGVKACSRVAVH